MTETVSTVLVVGRSGQLARSISACAWSGLDVVCLGSDEMDLARPDAIASRLDAYAPALVVNAGAYTAVDKAEDDERAAFAVNRDGPAALASACARAGIPLIHVSTDYVFDGTKSGAYREDDAVAPLGVYGASKLAGEEAVRSACPRHVILRTSWVYSPYGSNFLKTMLRLAESRDEVSVVSDQFGCPTYAPDLADAIGAVAPRLLAGEEICGTFHAAGCEATNWHDFAAGIFAEAASRGMKVPVLKAIPTSDYPTPAKRPMNSRLDCSKLEAATGLRLPGWKSGVARCLDALGLNAAGMAATGEAVS